MIRDTLTYIFLMLTKPLLVNTPLRLLRRMQDLSGDAMLKRFHARPVFEHTDDNRVCKAGTGAKTDTCIIYMHGGAYEAGDEGYVRGVSGVLTTKLGADVIGCIYRLAPEYPYPCALFDCMDVYREYSKKYKRTILLGDSAGGGMVFSLCSMIRDAGEDMPYALVAFSPWTDLTFSGRSYSYNRFRDPTLSKRNLCKSASEYLGQTCADNPLVSPVFCDTAGFPKTLIFAGSCEILLSDAKNMHENLISHGVQSNLIVHKGMWHVYPFFDTGYDREIFSVIKEFTEL